LETLPVEVIIPNPNKESTTGRRFWIAAVLRDVHFWVPLAALIAGALILYLVQ